MISSTRTRRWLLALLLPGMAVVAHAASTTSNLERERYWADQLADGIVVGEAVWLSNRGHRFLAISAAPDKPARTAVILIHGRGVHPTWGFIDKLYRDLPDSGYHTLSLQMPILANESKFSAYGPTFPEAFERIDAGVRYLQQKHSSIKRWVLVGHSSGAMTVVAYAARKSPPGLAGVAAIGLSTLSGGPEAMQPVLQLKTVKVPVLDVYGANDLPEVVNFAADRQRSATEAGNRRYRAQRTPDADHFFSDQYPVLLETLKSWLATLAPAS